MTKVSKQTEVSQTVPSVRKAIYADSTSITLPKLEELYDSVNIKMHVLSTGAATNLYLGAVSPGGITSTVGSSILADVTITNIGSSTFLVLANLVDAQGDNVIVYYNDITNDYAANNVVAQFIPGQSSHHYAVASI